MNGNDLLLCFADIGGEKLSAACDNAALRQSFQREKRRRIKTAAAVTCCAVPVIAAAILFGQNLLGKTPSATTSNPDISNVMPAYAPEEVTRLDHLMGSDALTSPIEVDPPQTNPEPATTGISAPAVDAPVTAAAEDETAFYMSYVYRIADGAYAGYIPGRVIASERVGEKLEDALVTGGWQYADGSMPESEDLKCEVYRISGVDPSVAVCIRFVDKGDALTTDHYYVQYNPSSDRNTLISDYVIVTEPPHEGEE